MPSGPKKRKKAAAAKKKQEEEEEDMGISHPPNNNDGPLHPQEAKAEMESSVESPSQVKDANFEQLSAAEISEVKEASIELPSASERHPNEILLAAAAPTTKEMAEAAEFAVEISLVREEVVCGNLGEETDIIESEDVVEAGEVPISVPADSTPQDEDEEGGELTNMGTIIEIPTVGPSNREVTRNVLEHRASFWNCCGLLDAFKGSEG